MAKDLEPSSRIWKALVGAVGIEGPEPGEEAEDFTDRVMHDIEALSDAKFTDLPTSAQDWANEYGRLLTENEEAAKEAERTGSEYSPKELPLLLVPTQAKEASQDAKASEGEPEVKQEKKMKASAKTKETPAKGKATKAEKAPSPRKAASKGAAANARTSTTNGRGSLAEDATIKILVTENPRREGTCAAKAYDLYRDGDTIGDFLEKFKSKKLGDVARARRKLRRDVETGIITTVK